MAYESRMVAALSGATLNQLQLVTADEAVDLVE